MVTLAFSLPRLVSVAQWAIMILIGRLSRAREPPDRDRHVTVRVTPAPLHTLTTRHFGDVHST